MFSVSTDFWRKMISFSKNYLSILLLVLITLLKVESHICIGRAPHVTILLTNMLSGNIPLDFHCKDKNNDLGRRTLHPGETYQFTFKPSLWTVTDYWCDFYWIGDSRSFHVYVQHRDPCHRTKFTYRIQQSGPCRIIGDSQDWDCYPWDGKTAIVEKLLN